MNLDNLKITVSIKVEKHIEYSYQTIAKAEVVEEGLTKTQHIDDDLRKAVEECLTKALKKLGISMEIVQIDEANKLLESS